MSPFVLAGAPEEDARPNPSRPHFRRQPPVASVLSFRHLGRAMRRAADPARDSRDELTALLRRHYHASEVELVGSGTSALELAIRRGVRQPDGGSVVALPAYTCFNVATAAMGAGVRILFYDIDPATLAPDPASLLAALRRGARVVVVSHLFGYPVDWRSLRGLVDEYGALIVEDAAQGHGGFLEGRRLGTLGRISVLSFGRGKGWSGGHGGAVLVRGMGRETNVPGEGFDVPSDSRWKGEAGVFLSVAAQAFLGRPSMYWLPAGIPWLKLGESVYRPPTEPVQLGRLAAALVAGSRMDAARAACARRRVARRWAESLLRRPSVKHIQPLEGAVPGYLRYPLLLSQGLGGFRDLGRVRRLGVESAYPHPLLGLSAIRPRVVSPTGSFPGAEDLARGLVTLPTHHLLREDDIDELIGLVNGYGGYGEGKGRPRWQWRALPEGVASGEERAPRPRPPPRQVPGRRARGGSGISR